MNKQHKVIIARVTEIAQAIEDLECGMPFFNETEALAATEIIQGLQYQLPTVSSSDFRLETAKRFTTEFQQASEVA